MENPTEKNGANVQIEAADNMVKINKKTISMVASVIVVFLVIILAWGLVTRSNINKADEAIAVADLAAASAGYQVSDSVVLAKYLEAAEHGTKSGNRAKITAAIGLYQNAEYEKAAALLDDASSKSEIIDAGRLTLLGDCYVNLEKYDQAISAYKKAVSAADGNPQIIPFILVKEANVFRAQAKYNDEYKAYQQILNDYPDYARAVGVDMLRNLAARAHEAAAAK